MASQHQPGDVIDDRYELLFEMRAGGMGAVWRARDLLEEQEVVIKEIRFPSILDDAARSALAERLVNEARTLSTIHHAGLVKVLDVLDRHDPPLVVSEVVEGPTLEEVLAEAGEPLTPERAAMIGLQIVEALLACADQGLYHRFLRPSRVVIPYDGPLRLRDFGVSALIGDPDVSATGAVGDAVGFLPPEHRSVPAGSAAADMWALGVTLYVAVEGAMPFERESAKATLAAIADEAPREPLRAGALEPVLAALMAKAPEDRPDHHRARQLLRTVALVPVGAPGGPLAPAEALERMFHRDPDTPQLHLMPPEVDEPEVADASGPGTSEAGGTATGTEGAGTNGAGAGTDSTGGGGVAVSGRPKAPPTYSPAERRTRWGWTVVAVLSIAGITGSLYAVGGQRSAERQEEARQESWVSFTHPDIGYTLSRPEGWTESRDGNLVNFTDPVTGAAVRVGFQDPPRNTPVGLWLELEEGFQAEQPTYRRLRLNQSVHDGFPAAVWEFTWVHEGLDLHNYDIAFTTGRQTFALNFQAQEAEWGSRKATFDRLLESFEPPA